MQKYFWDQLQTNKLIIYHQYSSGGFWQLPSALSLYDIGIFFFPIDISPSFDWEASRLFPRSLFYLTLFSGLPSYYLIFFSSLLRIGYFLFSPSSITFLSLSLSFSFSFSLSLLFLSLSARNYAFLFASLSLFLFFLFRFLFLLFSSFFIPFVFLSSFFLRSRSLSLSLSLSLFLSLDLSLDLSLRLSLSLSCLLFPLRSRLLDLFFSFREFR